MCTPSIAVLALAFSDATLSAVSAPLIAVSPAVFLDVTSFSFAVFSVDVKLASALIALISFSAAVANSAIALVFNSSKLTFGATVTASL